MTHPEYPAGTPVLTRGAEQRGTATGHARLCRLEGCRGLRIQVRWPDGTRTLPCSAGMSWDRLHGAHRIGEPSEWIASGAARAPSGADPESSAEIPA